MVSRKVCCNKIEMRAVKNDFDGLARVKISLYSFSSSGGSLDAVIKAENLFYLLA